MLLKNEIPANPLDLVSLINFIFFFVTPPKAIIFLSVSLVTKLYLLIPKKFVLFLNIEDKKISLTFCFSFILISFKLWAEPNNKKFFL
mgnify:CR=1 FL=1